MILCDDQIFFSVGMIIFRLLVLICRIHKDASGHKIVKENHRFSNLKKLTELIPEHTAGTSALHFGLRYH